MWNEDYNYVRKQDRISPYYCLHLLNFFLRFLKKKLIKINLHYNRNKNKMY